MNEEQPYIIETEVSEQSNNFPVLAQLGVLLLILGIIFSSLLAVNLNKQENIVEAVEDGNNLSTAPVAVGVTASAEIKKIPELDLRAKAAFVWDVREQKILYAKNAEENLPLASITKLMTALLTHELLSEEELLVVPVAAIKQEGSSGLLVGEVLSVSSLRDFALISSSNDAAYTLGASAGELLGDVDPTEQFVQGMNIRAVELQLDSLTFWNTTGLDLSTTKPGAVGSARDVSLLMAYIVNNYPDIIAATQQSSAQIYNDNGNYHNVSNTNDIVLDIPGMIGSKTGYTDLAGGNLTISFNVGLDHPIVITVLGSTRNERFTDMLVLVEEVKSAMVN